MSRILKFRNVLKLSSFNKRSLSSFGYYVLFPEVPPHDNESNQLFSVSSIPDFGRLTHRNCLFAVGKCSMDIETGVWSLEDNLKSSTAEKSFEEVFGRLEDLGAPFLYSWSCTKILYFIRNDLISKSNYEEISERARNSRSRYFHSLPIYFACKEFDQEKGKTLLQKRLLKKFLLEGKLSGIELQGSKKSEYESTLRKLNENRLKFRKNVKTSTEKFRHLIVDPKHVGEMSSDGLLRFSRDKSQPHKGPWIVTLQKDIYNNFLEYCPERALRWNAWTAYNSRSSGEHEKHTSNSLVIEEIRENRRAQAQLLGFQNYVELSMETKMAGVENIKSMLSTLLNEALERQNSDYNELSEFAASRGFESHLRPWDIHFWRRRFRRSFYNVDEQIIKEYFPLQKVLENLFTLFNNYFNIEITPVKREEWNKGVKLYKVSENGAELGHFYFDPFKRDGKVEEGNFTFSLRNRCDRLGLKPLSYLFFNFDPPPVGRDSLLKYDELMIVFEKFGTLLQQILTKVPYTELSGTTNIEWDAVGVPSNFLCLWLGNREIVKEISSHEKTGDKIPDKLLSDLLGSRKHFAAFDLCHQLYLSALDIEIYEKNDFWGETMKRLYPVYSPFQALDRQDSHICSFTEIFSGDYAGAYYSILWSKLLAADVYRGFLEANDLRTAGLRFRESFLEMGGGRHPSEVFRLFRGRDPSPNAFLWSLGLKKLPKIESQLLEQEGKV